MKIKPPSKNKPKIIHSLPKSDLPDASLEEAIQKRINPRDNSSVIPGLDMEGLKRSLDLLKYALDYSEAIVETVKTPLIVLDSKLKVLTANRSFYETFKAKPKDTENKLIYKLGDNEWDIPKLRILLEEILPKNKHFDNYEVEINFTHIGNRVMLLSARRTYRQVNNTEAILLAFEDITARKQLEQQKDDFIGIVSHELKTPLTGIKAFSQILEKHLIQKNDKRGSYLLSRMTSQMERLTQLMASFVNVYKIQNGKLVVKKKNFALDELIDSIAFDFQTTTKSHSVINNSKSNLVAYADRNRIEQVLINLISNAVKYSPEGNKVILDSTKDKDKVTISVQDFGMGIPKQEQGKVFERFFRVKGKKEKNISGLGLGLFISNEIVVQHKGKMWLESREEKTVPEGMQGSTFYFSLPLKMSGTK